MAMRMCRSRSPPPRQDMQHDTWTVLTVHVGATEEGLTASMHRLSGEPALPTKTFGNAATLKDLSEHIEHSLELEVEFLDSSSVVLAGDRSLKDFSVITGKFLDKIHLIIRSPNGPDITLKSVSLDDTVSQLRQRLYDSEGFSAAVRLNYNIYNLKDRETVGDLELKHRTVLHAYDDHTTERRVKSTRVSLFSCTFEEHQELDLTERLEIARIKRHITESEWRRNVSVFGSDGSIINTRFPIGQDRFPVNVKLSVLSVVC